MSGPRVDKRATPLLGDENALKIGIFATNLREWAELLKRLWTETDEFDYRGRFFDVPREILAACRAGDGREASRGLAAHLARSALTLLAQLAPDAQPVAVRAALRMLSAGPPAPVPV